MCQACLDDVGPLGQQPRKKLAVIHGRSANFHVEGVDERHGSPGPSVLFESRAIGGSRVGGWNMSLDDAVTVANAILRHAAEAQPIEGEAS